MAPIPRLKAYAGPAILSYGFRPFFLCGALFAALAIALWLPQFFGEISLPNVFAPPVWHAHEMLFGFVPAIVTGFLLTAIPNWTGRLPLQGMPLLALLLVWLAGRIAIAASGAIGWAPTMALDCAYLLVLALVIAREIVAGKNWRNLKVLVIIALLFAANVAFHIEAHVTGAANMSERAAIAAIVALVTLIGGRVTPSFTRNWLVRENPGRLPASADRLDAGCVAISVVALVCWSAASASIVTAAFLSAAAVAQAIRLARWVGWRAWRDPLVLVLHIFYGFIPLGFLLNACAILHPDMVPPSAGVHAWTIGAGGGMILAVMTRATLGHTGRALVASRATVFIYIALAVSALARIAAALDPQRSYELLHLAAAGWILAFVGFAAVYGPYLARPRRKVP
jgi:uncharacterized protein involved in response to NO